MTQKQRLQTQILKVREMTEAMLQAFQEPAQWTHQVHPCANHALWFAGHMGLTDNFFVTLADPTAGKEMPGFREKFGPGSTPTSDPADYPPVEEVLGYMRDRRAALLAALDAMSETDLAKSTPEGTPDMWPDYASVFEMCSWHEALHAGQMSVARRALGSDPLFRPRPKK